VGVGFNSKYCYIEDEAEGKIMFRRPVPTSQSKCHGYFTNPIIINCLGS
jgi:hypothetical protein